MKTKALVFAAVAAACLSSGAALAQSYDYGYRGDRYERDHRYEQRRDYGHRHRARGAGPYHDIYRGERLPEAYWNRSLRVNNWRRAGLPAPMYGHNWVRTGDDYALVSVNTGIIARIEFGD
jgi:Ni/Co efflux regulator RcnB